MAPSRRIVIITYHWEGNGGAEAGARTLAHELARRGHEVSVITTRPSGGLRAEQDGELTVYGFRPWNLYWVGEKDARPAWQRVLWQLGDVWNPHVYAVCRRLLARLRPDVVHVHKLRGLSPSVWSAARAVGVPALVQTCRDYELISPEGTLSTRIGRWADEGRAPFRLYQLVRARASRSVNAATAPSRYTLETVSARGFFPRAVKRPIPNCHGLASTSAGDLAPEKVPERASARRVLYIGRLVEEKGLRVLFDAFRRASADLELVIAGWGELEEWVRAQAEHHPRIRFVGTALGEAKRRLFATSDAVVVPSIWPETFGVVVVESFAEGTPVIASRTGGLPELIDPGRTGWLVDPGEPHALRSALDAVPAPGRELARMREACIEESKRFALDQVASDYLALYQSLLERSTTGRQP